MRSSAWFSIAVIAAELSAQTAPPAAKWVAVYEMSAKRDVALNPDRLFHGPAAVAAPNGDFLVAYQDSIDHSGHDSVISQARSSDGGRTWKPDGIVFDGRGEGCFGRQPAYGVSAAGEVILVIQCWQPLPAGQTFSTFRKEGIAGSVWSVSRDNGKTYQRRGLVDSSSPLRHQGSSSPILRVGDELLMIAIAIESTPRGISLYRMADSARGWTFAGFVFRSQELTAGAVSYPSIVQRRDGSLLAHCHSFLRHYRSVSTDGGNSWSTAEEFSDLRIANNSDLEYAGDVLVAHGRGEDMRSTVLYFSPDEGKTWGSPVVLDRYGFCGWGGYSASLRMPGGGVFVAFSTDAGPNTCKDGGKPDIRGVAVTGVQVRRNEIGRARHRD